MLEAVAFADMVTLVEVIDAIVAPTGIPVPAMSCPTANPATLDTAVRTALPEVAIPVNRTVCAGVEAVAFADIVIELAVTAVMLVPAAIPVPVIGWPMITPAILETPETVGLPAVRLPVVTTWLVNVAGAEIVMVVVPIGLSIVAPDGMPVPVITCPTMSPLTLDRPVIVALPEVT